MKKQVLEFISNILACLCIGGIVDHFAKTGYTFAIIGALVGVAVAIIIQKTAK